MNSRYSSIAEESGSSGEGLRGGSFKASPIDVLAGSEKLIRVFAVETFPLFLALLTAYLFLGLADYFTTMAVVNSGVGREVNPIMAPLVKAGEPALWAQVAFGLLSAVFYIIDPKEAVVGLLIATVLKALVVANNSINAYLAVLKLKK